MINYKKTYINALGYDVGDFISSELSGVPAVDFHHIIGRGKGGEDRIENLIAVSREEHIQYGDKKQYMVMLLTKHREFLAINGVRFSMDWFDEKINYYKSITA